MGLTWSIQTQRWALILGVFWAVFDVSSPGLAQYKTPLDELVLPQHRVRTLPHGKSKTWVMLSKNDVSQNLRYYLQLCQRQGIQKTHWRLDAPTVETAEVWLQGLAQTPAQENANFMLNLHHIQSDINVVLTLGEIKSTTAHPFRSIITLYTVPKRKGGK